MARYGRLVWKTVDTVVELTEQKRMQEDPEYATACQHLRIRKCDLSDMKMFNSCLVQSHSNPNGTNLLPYQDTTTVIVHRNVTRQHLNQAKVLSITQSPRGPSLVRCYARHTIGKQGIPLEIQKQLQHAQNHDGSPAYLDIYIGAPVILRNCNLSQELHITNGAQGVVQGISLVPLFPGSKMFYASAILVEFPSSPVQLSHLPSGYFPIIPVATQVTTAVYNHSTGISFTIKATRYQLPIQLAFAITSHGAQGKTLPHVTADLTEKADGLAYVAASRATNRHGLSITHEITSLSQLNRPLNRFLLAETKCLEALEHNTLVHYGFMPEGTSLVAIPDPEDSKDENDVPIIRLAVIDKQDHAPSKPKFTEIDNRDCADAYGEDSCLKKQKDSTVNHLTCTSNLMLGTASNQPTSMRLVGCKWDRNNYSCAYDSILTPMVHLLNEKCSSMLQKYSSAASSHLNLILTNVLSSPQRTEVGWPSQLVLHDLCMSLWVALHVQNPNYFPWGCTYAAVEDVLSYLLEPRPLIHPQIRCTVCNSILCDIPTGRLPVEPSHAAHQFVLEAQWTQPAHPLVSCYSDWDVWWQGTGLSLVTGPINHTYKAQCQMCSSCTMPAYFLNIIDLAPFIHLSIINTPHLTPALSFTAISTNMDTITYKLGAIVYFGSCHFTSQLILNNGSIWKYDGMLHEGCLVPDGSVCNFDGLVPECLKMLDNCIQSKLIYIACS